MSEPDFIPNAEAYAAASQPHATVAEGEAALHAFMADVAAARAKHRIADVVLRCSLDTVDKAAPHLAMSYTAGDALHHGQLALKLFQSVRATELAALYRTIEQLSDELERDRKGNNYAC